MLTIPEFIVLIAISLLCSLIGAIIARPLSAERFTLTLTTIGLGVSLMLCILASLGCAASPVAASAYVPQHHNVPATFVGAESGPVVWLCATQLRGYGGSAEEDHYLQYSPCPVVPIP